VRIGAQVQTGGDPLRAIRRAHEIGAEVLQIFALSPRVWRSRETSRADAERFREALRADPLLTALFCHGSYLANLATDDAELLARARASLVANLRAAGAMGASGLVVHVGSHLGRGLEACLQQVADALVAAIGEARAHGADGCPILLENTAGGGGSVGRSFEELATVLDRAGAGDALGVCLDTQHLWASGVPFGSREAADAVVASLGSTVGLAALRVLHVNDSKTPFGSGSDRHANPGEGAIGDRALGWLLSHPALGAVPAVLEVPGAGRGPRAEDLERVRRALENGRRRRARREAGARHGLPAVRARMAARAEDP
jgi:deoxyribonuclease-4